MKILLRGQSFSMIGGGKITHEKKLLMSIDPNDKMYKIDVYVQPNIRHSLKFSKDEMKDISEYFNANK